MDPRQFCTTLESADADRLQIMRQYDPRQLGAVEKSIAGKPGYGFSVLRVDRRDHYFAARLFGRRGRLVFGAVFDGAQNPILRRFGRIFHRLRPGGIEISFPVADRFYSDFIGIGLA